MLSNRFTQALVYAKELHDTQTRKGGNIPYFAHLMGVASIALEYGANEDEAIAALLHDAIEDQGGPPTGAEIRRRFGDTVADIVEGCTDADATPKPPWRRRKEVFIAELPTASPSVRLVSAADKLYNSWSILKDYRVLGESVWRRFKGGGKKGTLWYYRSLVTALRQGESIPNLTILVDELDRVVTKLEQLVAANE